MTTVITLEILGWVIIVFEMFGARSNLSSSVDAVHSAMKRFAELALFSKVANFLVVWTISSIIAIIVHFSQPSGIYGHFEATILERIFFGFDILQYPRRIIPLFSVSSLVAAVFFVPFLLFLRLVERHPEGILGGLGLVLALGSSIISRL